MTPDQPDQTGPVASGHRYPHAAAGGRDPSRAIETKQAQAAANRDKIVAAIAALQRTDQPINVQSVARAAGVHPMTLRRNPTLLAEVQRLREASWQRMPARHVDPEAAASHQAVKARLVASQQEVVGLRRQLAQLRKDAHQALGTAPSCADPALVEGLQREAAELRVRLGNEQDTTRGLRDTVRGLQDELTASHEIARGYLRDLDQAQADLRSARQELMKLRTPAGRQVTPEPSGGTSTGRAARGTPGPWVDLSDAIGPGWRLIRETDSTSPGQLWRLEHDQERVGTVRRESTARGRTAWSARTRTGHEVTPPTAFAAAAGSSLWRTRDLAAAALAQRPKPAGWVADEPSRP